MPFILPSVESLFRLDFGGHPFVGTDPSLRRFSLPLITGLSPAMRLGCRAISNRKGGKATTPLQSSLTPKRTIASYLGDTKSTGLGPYRKELSKPKLCLLLLEYI
uniref:Uncharacterized protein n=1 Tax=Utricularia reniformis TaxID=192314 RepID=A0A1Y0B0M2_9LAMI|nr:hypothetical protein AEK19_MT0671 [Utricularia reniformis]ART30921.1 hypothetical protein AEK19_MT0671 [Utricularia reniformis]